MKKFALVAFVVGLVGIAQAADPTGTWTWESKRKGKDGNEVTVKQSMKLELKDGKLTGTVSGGGRGGKAGGKAMDSKIEDGKFKDDELSFTVTREFGENKFVSKYSGKVTDDTIKGTITTDFNGKENKQEFEAKRSKEEKKKD
jgi:hypothetical protein